MSTSPATGRSERERRGDVVSVLLAAIFGIGIFAYHQGVVTSSPLVVTLDVVAGTIGCLAVWWRRRWPVQIAAATAVAASFSELANGPTVVMLFSVALLRGARPTALIAVANVASSTVLALVRPEPDGDLFLDALISALVVAAVAAWGMFAGARGQLALSRRDRAARVQRENRLTMDQARRLERARIAREMHDVLGHRLSLINLHAGALEYRVGSQAGSRAGTTDPEIRESAAVIRASARQALEDLREVIGVLRRDVDVETDVGIGTHTDGDGDSSSDPGIDLEPGASERPQPTLGDVPALVEEGQRAGMNITLHFQVGAGPPPLPLTVGRAAYRVVQEGLTNARKHAPAAAVLVQVSAQPGPGMLVEVRNRPPLDAAAGPGQRDGAPEEGRGLTGLAERAELLGGRLDHGRTPEGDFVLRCWLPWSLWPVPDRTDPDV